MTNQELFDRIRRFCKANADEKNVQKYLRYFKEGYNGYGVSVSAFENEISSLMDSGQVSLKLICETAPLLLKSGKYEETSFALVLLKKHSAEFTPELFTKIEKWFDYGINNWAHADMISLDILSYFLINKIIPLRSFNSWRSAVNKYQRRSAAVSLIKYIKSGAELPLLLKFIEPLMTDEAREIHQGVGWFLREAWKIKRPETESFLLKWKNKSPRLIYQYATEKMTAKDKQRFRRDEKKS